MRFILFSLYISILCFSSENLLAQGKIILAGGGGEAGWSNVAYGWGVAQAPNKKVGIISYYDESEALPDYFKGLGAESAVNIRIGSREAAESDTLYNYLMSFDFLFFKGGDQSNYYQTYKNSPVTEAIEAKYQEGGVLGGTSAGLAILTGVMYSANNGSVYPDEGLLDINESKITLHDDFVNILPGYLGDTHFVERGRQFRLMAFLARWYRDEGELLTGIGVDDKTALCIDEELVGTAIGTGAVSFYFPADFSYEENQFYTDSLYSVQLIDSNQFDLKTGELLSFGNTDIAPLTSDLENNYTVLVSGSVSLASDEALINDFKSTSNPEDSILIVSSSRSDAQPILQKFTDLPYTLLEIMASSNHEDSTRLRNNIRKAKKVIFYNNDHLDLMAFMSDGPTGSLLKDHLRRNDMVVAFTGEDSPLAGSYFATNNLTDELASFRKQLEYEEGLDLLQGTILMTNTIDRGSTDFYENNTSAVLYALNEFQLKYGMYLNSGSYLKIHPESDMIIAEQHGNYPSVLVTNISKIGEKATSRNVISADGLIYQILLDEQMLALGTPRVTDDSNYEFETVEKVLALNPQKGHSFYPNPVRNNLFINRSHEIEYTITDLSGRTIQRGITEKVIDFSQVRSGTYLLIIKENYDLIGMKIVKE